MSVSASPVALLSLLDVLKNFKLRVPSYQRPYAWRPEQVDALLDDIDALGTAKETSRRFLGYLTVYGLQADSSVLYLIDGQQRVTTISLVCAVVCDEMRKLGATAEAESFEREVLYDDLGSPETYRYLPQDYSDTGLGVGHRGGLQSIYRHVIAGDTGLNADSVLAGQVTPAARRLMKTREKVRQWVRKQMRSREQVADMLSKLNRLDVVLHRVANDAEGAEIFDGINNRGKKLSDVEKVKSYALYLYNKSVQGDVLMESIEKTNGSFENTYRLFDKYDISDDKSETQFVDAYFHCFADHATAYLSLEGAVGEYGGEGAESLRSLLPISVLHSSVVPDAVTCLGKYLAGYPKAAEWFGDIARVQQFECYQEFTQSKYRDEMVAISHCLKLLRRSTVAAPVVMAYRKVNPGNDEGLIALLRYLERLMFQLSLDGRKVNKGAALISRLARETVVERLSSDAIVKRIHDEVAPDDEGAEWLIANKEELMSSATGLAYRGRSIPPAALYAHYHWLKKNRFKVSFYGLRRIIRDGEFHFVVKPTRHGNIHREHDDFRCKTLRDHPANVFSDIAVGFHEGDVDLLKSLSVRERIDWLSGKYPGRADFFSLDGARAATWLERKTETFSDWFVRRWSLERPTNLPAVKINLHDQDFEGFTSIDSDEADDSDVVLS